MSAYVVDRIHIDLLVTAGLRGPAGRPVNPQTAWRRLSWFTVDRAELESTPWDLLGDYRRELTYQTADEVGSMLWGENMVSVAHRYGDDTDLPGPVGVTVADALTYTHTDPGYRMTAVEALQAIAGYSYQACEHPGWPTSEAYAFCDALRHGLINALPGIDEAPWTWGAADVAAARAGRVLRP